MRKILLALSFFFAVFQFTNVFAQESLPQARVSEREQGRAEDVFGARYTSQPFLRYPNVKGILRQLNWPWFRLKNVAGVNLTQVSTRLMNDFISESGEFSLLGVKPEAKVMIFLTMNLGDPAITRALIRAKDAGFGEVRVIVDGQSGLKLKDAVARQPKVTLDEHVEFLDNDAGRALSELTAAGFKINDAENKFTINTPRVLRRENSIRPLQHMKGLLFLIKEEPGHASWLRTVFAPLNPRNWAPLFTRLLPGREARNNFERQAGKDVRVAGYFLTDNATHRSGANAIYNRMLEVLDRELLLDQVDHANRMTAAFSGPGAIKDIKMLPPQRVSFPDGSFVEQAFTDGKFNTGNYLVDLLRRGRAGEFTIENMWLSEYSLAMGDFIEALQDYMDFDLSMTVPMAVFDASFVSGSGLAGTLAGFANSSGKEIVRGFSPSACARINAFVHRREVADPEATETGRMTWHDKMSIARVKDKDDKLWHYIYVRSANLSEHAEENSEIAFFMKLPADSELASWFQASLTGHVLMKPKLFTPIARDAFRVTVAGFLGLTPALVPMASLSEIERHLRVNNYVEVGKALTAIYLATPERERKIDAGELAARLELAAKFFEWYRLNVWPTKYYRGEPPARRWLYTDLKDWALDRLESGRTHLRIQQLGPLFKMISDRQKGEIEKTQVQRLLHSMAPDTNIADAEAEVLSRALLKQMKLKGGYARLPSSYFEQELAEFRAPGDLKCQTALAKVSGD